MPEDKKKPGMALVISVTKPSPKKPTETATPDKKEKAGYDMKKSCFDVAWSVLKREATIYDQNIDPLGMQQRQGTATLDPNYPADRATMARQAAAKRQQELERQRMARQVAERAQEEKGIAQGRMVGSPYQ